MNPFLQKVHYQPEDGGNAGGEPERPNNPTSAEQPEQRTNTAPVYRLEHKRSWSEIIFGNSVRGLSTGVAAAGIALLVAAFTQDDPPPPSTPPSLPTQLIVLKMERFRDFQSAIRRQGDAPIALGLFSELNSGNHQHVIGAAPKRQAYWVALPRPGYEKEFAALAHRGFDKVWLTSVYPPPSIDAATIDRLIYKWAERCGVRSHWIKTWSSFRDDGSKRLENRCHAGGVCLILSFEPCAGNAFEDFRTMRIS